MKRNLIILILILTCCLGAEEYIGINLSNFSTQGEVYKMNVTAPGVSYKARITRNIFTDVCFRYIPGNREGLESDDYNAEVSAGCLSLNDLSKIGVTYGAGAIFSYRRGYESLFVKVGLVYKKYYITVIIPTDIDMNVRVVLGVNLWRLK